MQPREEMKETMNKGGIIGKTAPERTMYFHLKLHFPGGSMYQYSFAFSDSRATPGQF